MLNVDNWEFLSLMIGGVDRWFGKVNFHTLHFSVLPSFNLFNDNRLIVVIMLFWLVLDCLYIFI